MPDTTDEITPETGPGLEATGTWDRLAFVAAGFALLGLLPKSFFKSAFTAHALGPLAFSAILAIVGVLFGFLVLFRYGELQHRPSRDLAIAAIAIGLARLLIAPMLA